jgi:acetyl/propionyl-CoA carboxylase alpha subunit
MADAAVAAARAAGYRNAGTIEFLLEGNGDAATFYFLEMNTRLQVEHAVTEAVVGIDMVRAQLLVASGEPLPWGDGSLVQRGHAIEARIYAEDPALDFLPQAGPLLLYREPRRPGIRVDAGVIEGGEVPVHYDPMLAKVIALGENRGVAIERLVAALRDYPILGVRTNIAFLIGVLEHPRFRAADIDTGFLDRENSAVVSDVLPPFLREALLQIGDGVSSPKAQGLKPEAWSLTSGPRSPEPEADPWSTLRGWRP